MISLADQRDWWVPDEVLAGPGKGGREALTAKAKRGHRPHNDVARSVRKWALFTPEENALIEQASARRGLRPGAYVSAAAVEMAKAETSGATAESPATTQDLRELAAEVRELRRLLGNVAGNLNDVARHANSTGELGQNAEAILDYTRRTNTRIDAWLMQMLRSLR